MSLTPIRSVILRRAKKSINSGSVQSVYTNITSTIHLTGSRYNNGRYFKRMFQTFHSAGISCKNTYNKQELKCIYKMTSTYNDKDIFKTVYK